MKPASTIAEEESRRIFWVIQTIFGFIIAHSFYTYGAIFIPPFRGDIITLSFALLSVYLCVIWSWIDFSFILIKNPYQFRGKLSEKFRFFSDLFIVSMYSYLLVDLDHIYRNPEDMILEFFIAFILIYFGYISSGLLRKAKYGRRASRTFHIGIFFLLFISTALLYYFFYEKSPGNTISVNRFFIIITICLTIIYRISRSLISKRQYTIAIDVDGVLANQIDGILPVIKKEHGVQLNYRNVTSWNLPIKDSSIDKIIVEEQKQRGYIVNMPLFLMANEVVNKLIKKHYIAIATSRPLDTDKWTKEWLTKNEITYDRFHNLKEGGKQNADEDFDILIDDYIGNIKAFLEKHEGRAILFSQPWNQDRSNLEEFIKNGRLLIVNNWGEVEQRVKQILENN